MLMLMLVLMLMLMLMLVLMQVGDQGAASCFRAKGEYKHLCAYQKASSGYCGGGHTGMEHDPAEHGN